MSKKEIYQEIVTQLQASAELKRQIELKCIDDIYKTAITMIEVFKNGGKVFLCGNGGSAADSQHIAAELLVKLNHERDALPASALTTDTSILTATANDMGFEKIFVRQLEALASQRDLLIGISTSGNSPNVIAALKYCNKKGIKAIGLTGEQGGELIQVAEQYIRVPANNVQRIQEGHITIGHILCDIIEKKLFAE